MPNPTILFAAGALCLVVAFAGTNFVSAQLENTKIKDEGVRLSERFVSAAYAAGAGPNGGRFKADHATAIQRAKDFPLVREGHWEDVTKIPSCAAFWRQARSTVVSIATEYGKTGIYSDEELSYASRSAAISLGVLASTLHESLERNGAYNLNLDEACTKGIGALTSYEKEAKRRVDRALMSSPISPEGLPEETVATMTLSLPVFFRAYNYTKN